MYDSDGPNEPFSMTRTFRTPRDNCSVFLLQHFMLSIETRICIMCKMPSSLSRETSLLCSNYAMYLLSLDLGDTGTFSTNVLWEGMYMWAELAHETVTEDGESLV
jgi:hypothetical protein